MLNSGVRSMEKVSDDLISVVVPVYNVEDYIIRCIKSIQNQTYNNLEIILIDDGSKDNCPQICDKFKKYDKRIKVIHKENGGLSSARNSGIDIAEGKYITFIDSDDYVEKNYVEELYYLIKKYNSKISMVDIIRKFDSGKVINNSTYEEYVLNQKDYFEKMLYGERDLDNSASAKLYDIKLFDDVRYPDGRLYEDTATTYKLILKCKIIPVKSAPLYNYMIRETSIVQCNFNEKKMQLIESTQEMTDMVRKIYPELERACLRKEIWARFSTLSQLAVSDLRNKKIEEELIDFINENKEKFLKDKKISMRDKFGIFCLNFGFEFYRLSWKIYKKIRYGRK